MKTLAFKVIDGKKEYRFYLDGSVEGFSPDAQVFNYVPLIENQAVIDYQQTGQSQEAGV